MSSQRVREVVAASERAGVGHERVKYVCDLAAEALPVSGAGLSVTGGSGRHSRLAATDEVSERIEDLQVLLGQGPCVDAVSSGMPVLVSDIADSEVEARWPVFAPLAAAIGVRAAFALPLLVGEVRLGALDLYRDGAGPLGDRQVVEAQEYALAAVEVLLALQLDQQPGALGPLAPGWESSSAVHQATGMGMVQLGTDPAAAFAALRARAFRDGRTLHEVARDVIERRLRLGPEE